MTALCVRGLTVFKRQCLDARERVPFNRIVVVDNQWLFGAHTLKVNGMLGITGNRIKLRPTFVELPLSKTFLASILIPPLILSNFYAYIFEA